MSHISMTNPCCHGCRTPLRHRNSAASWKHIMIYDKCCGKIDLFRVLNRVAHILPWWGCCYLVLGDLYLLNFTFVTVTTNLFFMFWWWLSPITVTFRLDHDLSDLDLWPYPLTVWWPWPWITFLLGSLSTFMSKVKVIARRVCDKQKD